MLEVVDGGGAEVEVGTADIPRLDPDEVAAGVVFSVPAAVWTGEWVARVNALGADSECHGDDNEARWTGSPCS